MPDVEVPANARELMANLIAEINIVRANAKNQTYAPYTFNTTLTKVAINHCKWMAANASTSHTGLNNSMPGERVTEAGFIHNLVAENNLAGRQYQTAKQALHAWRTSQVHNQNLYLGAYRLPQTPPEIGIGTACILSVDGDIKTPYWCAVFAKEA